MKLNKIHSKIFLNKIMIPKIIKPKPNLKSINSKLVKKESKM